MAETLLLIHLGEVLNPAHNLKNQHLFGDSTRRISCRLTRGIGNPEFAATVKPPRPCCPRCLRIRTHHQKMTVAARRMAEQKTWAQPF